MRSAQQALPSGRRLVRICVTGGIACGKNLVGAALARRGVAVLDADRVCHAAMRAGGPLARRVAAAFGPRVVGRGGAIDRRVLGRLVFADAARRRRLNRLVHPVVIRAVGRWLRERAAGARRRRAAAVLVPLVYEAGWERAWDRIVCVAAPANLQLARLRRRGVAAAGARARIAAQWPVEEKMRRADHVVFNSGSPACARRQARGILEEIMRPVEKRYGRKSKTALRR